MKKKLLVAAAIAFFIYLAFNYINKDTYNEGLFQSKKFGFSLTFPEKWREIDKKEVLKTSNERIIVRNIDTRMFLTRSNPDETVFIISSLDQKKENFEKIPLDTIAGRFKTSRMTIELKEKIDIDGFTVIRVGGPFGEDQYMQVAFIPTEKGIVQFSYICKNSSYNQNIEEIDNIIHSLKKI